MPSTSPVRRHVLAGLAAALASMPTAGTLYFIENRQLDLPWGTWTLAMIGYGLLGGTLIGLAAGTAEARGFGPLRTVLAGAAAGVVPGLLGVLGFGSMHAPYTGTGLITVAILAGAAAYSMALAPRGDLGRKAVAASSAITAIGSIGVLGWLFFVRLHLIPPFSFFKQLTLDHGALFAGGLGAGLGAVAGLFIVLARWLDRAAARAVGYDA